MFLHYRLLLMALVFGFFGSAAHASLAEKIDEVTARAGENLTKENDEIRLYGVHVNGPDTNYGRWACAKVVAVVLNEAGIGIFRGHKHRERRHGRRGRDHRDHRKKERKFFALAVHEIETALIARGWTPIHSEDELLPGDVIVWKHRFKGERGGHCFKGGGTCHVGIRSSAGTFHNHPIWGKPGYGEPPFWYTFKIAFRPPS